MCQVASSDADGVRTVTDTSTSTLSSVASLVSFHTVAVPAGGSTGTGAPGVVTVWSVRATYSEGALASSQSTHRRPSGVGRHGDRLDVGAG